MGRMTRGVEMRGERFMGWLGIWWGGRWYVYSMALYGLIFLVSFPLLLVLRSLVLG